MDRTKFIFNPDNNTITYNNSEFLPNINYNIDNNICKFSIYQKKDGSHSIYVRCRPIKNNKINVSSIFKKLKELNKCDLISVDSFINTLIK